MNIATFSAGIELGHCGDTIITASSFNDAWKKSVQWARDTAVFDCFDRLTIGKIEWHGNEDKSVFLSIRKCDSGNSRSDRIQIPVPATAKAVAIKAVGGNGCDKSHEWTKPVDFLACGNATGVTSYSHCAKCGIRRRTARGTGSDGTWYASPPAEWVVVVGGVEKDLFGTTADDARNDVERIVESFDFREIPEFYGVYESGDKFYPVFNEFYSFRRFPFMVIAELL